MIRFKNIFLLHLIKREHSDYIMQNKTEYRDPEYKYEGAIAILRQVHNIDHVVNMTYKAGAFGRTCRRERQETRGYQLLESTSMP